MERECFENDEIARLMNKHFISIKVDREERPDLDEVYMRAVQLLTGAGGWPLTVFLMPDLVPFYGGTYYPPEDRHGMPGFPRVLQAVHEAYANRHKEVETTARQVLEAIEKSARPAPAEGALTEDLLETAVRAFSAQFDLQYGGFGVGAKFPQAPALDFLLRLWSRAGDERPLLMATMTLEKMAAGGIFDQVGGGFHRYTVDRMWRTPHFEKMLYDNAQLVGLYAEAFRATANGSYLATARATADYVLRQLRSPEGAFYSAQDADSEGVEGRYYVWTYDEILKCLGQKEGQVVARYLGAVEEGNWEEGKNILRRSIPIHGLAGLFGMNESETEAVVGGGLRRLLEKRRERVAPETDRKVLTDWNSLMVSGLVRLHRATGDGEYVAAARRCMEFVLGEPAGGAVMHNWREGRATVPGFLSDHAMLAGALLDLYETTFEIAYLRRAGELAATMVKDYWDEKAGTFNEVGSANEKLLARVRTLNDQPLPSGCSAACHVLLRLGALCGEQAYVEKVERALRAARGLMEQSPVSTAHMLSAALRTLSASREFVIVGLENGAAGPLRALVDEFYLPHLARAGADSNQAAKLSAEIPLLEGKEAAGGRPTAYVCSGGACSEPVQDPVDLRRQLASLLPNR
jgi:hypothetical protein